MMSYTHVVVGIGSSIAIIQPQTTKEYLATIAGGAIGGIICDIDVKPNKFNQDALYGWMLGAGILIGALLIDWKTEAGICEQFLNRNIIMILAGVAAIIALVIRGVMSKHRTFSHSLLALILFSIAIFLVSPIFVPSFAIGFASHLALDVLNKSPIKILYPFGKKGICLKLFYANKIANNVILGLGVVFIILEVILIS